MKRFFRFLQSYLRSAPRVVLFELMYKLLVSALAIPIFSILFETALNYSDTGYLRAGNLKKFLLSPVSIPILLLIMLIFGMISMLEITSLTVSSAYAYNRKRVGSFGMMKCGIKALLRNFRGFGIIIAVEISLLLAASQLLLYSGLFYDTAKNFLSGFFGNYSGIIFLTAVIIAEILIMWLISAKSYTFHYIVLTKSNLREALRKSRFQLKGKRLRVAFNLIIWMLAALVFASALTFTVSFLIIFGMKGFSRPEDALLNSLKVLSYAGKVIYAIISIVALPFIISGLTTRFMEDVSAEEKLVLPVPNEKSVPRGIKIALGTLVFAVGIFLNFTYIQAVYRGNVNFAAGIFTRTQVTAHRGFSYEAPENTLYAFQAAVDVNSDYIELDVQQTKDGRLVIFHDDNMKRTTGIDAEIGDFTYDELKGISAGSWFRRDEKDFSDAEIMLLSELLEFADESDILLNIEIKKTGNPVETAEKTAAMVSEYGMEDMCYITSFEHSALKAVKAFDPDIKTALITNGSGPLSYGKLDYIDGVSMNYLFVTKSVVRSCHMGGKKVFVWTVNNVNAMERMISIGADNIITDRPDLAAKTVYSYDRGDMALSVLEYIFS